jgi:alpha-galactosidase
MLEVGNGGMTLDEYRAHFALWAMLAAPLISGNDLSTMSAETTAILTNREIIAVDQDPLGIQGRRAVKQGDAEVWVRPLAGGSQAVLLLNRGAERRSIVASWDTLRWPSYLQADVRDLWRQRNLERASGSIAIKVAPHAAVILKVTPARNSSH